MWHPKLNRWVLDCNYTINEVCSSAIVSGPIYQPLKDPTSFRVIHLLPADLLEAPIVCGLLDASGLGMSEENYPGYTALSYTWGDAQSVGEEEISVN